MRRSGLTILLIAVLICIIGILSIYSSNYEKQGDAWRMIYKRQIGWLFLGLILFLIISNFNYRRFWDISYILYGVVIFLLSLVFISGAVRSGAQRWLKIAWFNLQPSEFAKLIMIIFLARYFSKKSFDEVSLSVSKFGILRALILPLIFISIPAGMIIEQPDLGTGIIIIGIFIAMLFAAGVRLRYTFLILLCGGLSVPVLWNFLRDYQKDRLLVFLNPNIDPLGAGYTVIQSKIAIGSGGFWGKGWLLGTQSQLHFLPESHTDFIFATFSEEWGFAGGIILVALYYFLIKQGIAIAERTSDYFGKLLAYGISLMLGIQVVINIAMNLGFAPVVGIPLPLMSYGGSSLLATFIALGILVNIAKERAVF